VIASFHRQVAKTIRELLSDGRLSDNAVARRAGVSVRTVRYHKAALKAEGP
jgi:DNA-binding CsgD family transcriptional regulator